MKGRIKPIAKTQRRRRNTNVARRVSLMDGKDDEGSETVQTFCICDALYAFYMEVKGCTFSFLSETLQCRVSNCKELLSICLT